MQRPASPTMETNTTGAQEEQKHEQRWWILATLSLSLLIIGLDNTILNVAIPTIQREFHSSASELQWMVDAYIVVFAGLLLVFGTLGDRFGRVKALQAGLLIFGLASLAAAFSQSAGQLIAARSIMGAGGAFIMPATLSILIDVFPKEERGRAISIWAGIAGLGIGLGPLTGGVLLEYFWWGSVFLINVPIVITAMIAGRLLIPESRDPAPPALDLLGAMLSLGTVTTLVYAIIEAPSRGWLDPLVVATFVVAIVLGVAFAVREITTAEPMLDLALFRNLHFSMGAAAIAFAFFSLFGMVFLLTQYFQFVRGYTALETGYRMIPVALGIMVGASQSHRLVTRFGTGKVVAAAMLALAIVLASMDLWTSSTPYWVIGIVLFFMAISMGNVMAPSTESVMSALPSAKAGVGSAMNDLVRQVAGALGVAIIGSIVNVVYAGNMEGSVSDLPPNAQDASQDSVGAALRIATQVSGRAGDSLANAARTSFVDAFGAAGLLAAAMVVVGSILIWRYLPSSKVEAEGATHKLAHHTLRASPSSGRGD